MTDSTASRLVNDTDQNEEPVTDIERDETAAVVADPDGDVAAIDETDSVVAGPDGDVAAIEETETVVAAADGGEAVIEETESVVVAEESAGDPAPDVDPAAETDDRTDPDFVVTPIFTARHPSPLTPEASPNGEWLAYFIETATDGLQLWLSPTDGGDPQQVELPFTPVVERDPDSGRLIRGPQWSPDGGAIALTGEVEGEDRTGIWIIPSPVQSHAQPTLVAAQPDEGEGADESGAEPAAGDGTEASTAEAPADDEAADAAAVPEIRTVKVDNFDPASVVEVAEPVAAAGSIEEGNANVVQAATASSSAAPIETHLLTWGPGSERSPRWSPDGNIIAFVSNRDGRDTIALATAGGDEPTIAELLTWSSADDREPVWSRDGRFLAFTRQRTDGPEHADIYLYSPESGELTNLTETKASAVRHSLDWVAGRNLVAYVTQDGDWLSISVINADNKAGWAVTRESGDKTEPRFHPTEARLVYVRSEGFATVCCERGLHASGAVALDPSEGVVHSPRWLMGKKVVYGFSAPQKPFGFLVQENLASSERTPLQTPDVPNTSGVTFRHPVPFEFPIGDDEQFSGMLYRVGDDATGESAAVTYLPDGPLAIRRADFNLEEQALAQGGLNIFTPVLHGSTGFGKGVEDDLADLSATEIEVSDIAEAGWALGEAEGIDPNRLALVGVGYGATLALLTAGARPGIYSAVVAIDPITEWSIELGECTPSWRNWVTTQYGMPLTHPDRYALRTPSTFAAVIDVPVILVSTAGAPVYRQAQTELLAGWLAEVGVPFEELGVPDEPLTATLERVGHKLATLLGGNTSDVETSDPTAEAPVG